MKKLITAGCCVLFLHNFSSASDSSSEEKANGQKVLVKAIAVIVNTESNKKLPPKPVFVLSSEPPWF